MTSKLNHCLICNSYLNHQKEITNDLDDDEYVKLTEVDNKKSLKVQLGLQLLHKLLNSEGLNHVEKINSSLSFVGGDHHDERGGGPLSTPPCCEECGLAIEEMVRLQHAIEEMKISLMKQVDKLKDSLLKSDCQEDPLKIPSHLSSFHQLRHQLLTRAKGNSDGFSTLSSLDHRPRPLRKKRRRPPSPPSPPSKLPKEYQPCSVILKRLSNHQLNSFLKPIQNSSSTHQSNDEDDPEFVPSPQTGSNQDFNDPLDSGDDYPWESESEAVPIPISPEQKFTPLTPHIRMIPKPSKKFTLITPSILLYQHTLIKVTQGYTRFTCQHPQCPSPIFSDPSPNFGASLFYLIADHIETTHSSPPSKKHDPLTLPLNCPLCPLTFPPGPQFRHHLVGTYGTHSVDTIVCELCWKPIRNVADSYRAHQWHHKNSQEKEETEGGPPPKIVYNAQKKLSTKQYKKHKNKKNQDPSILEAISLLNKLKNGTWKKMERVKNNSTSLKKVKQKKSLKTKVKLETQQINSLVTTAPPKGGSKFLLVAPNTLLYQYTLIKVSQGYTHFTCQENNCPSPNFSTDDLSNWIDLFDQVATHIESIHGDPLESAVRECELCSTQLNYLAKDWRRHFTGMTGGAHRIKTVVCQICLRPVINESTDVRCHLWSHKNKLEKEECEEGPPRKILARLKRKEKSDTGGGGGDQGSYQVKLEEPQETQLIVQKQFPKFYIISDDTLLYQYTLIKVSQGYTQFTCQEPGCPSPNFFNDDLLNWRCIFTQVASHINSLHDNLLESAVRECVVCAIKLTSSARDFRRHLTGEFCGGHGIKNVICETCLKPIHHVASLYRCHQWSHKSKQEKWEAPEGPPSKIKNAKQKYNEKKMGITVTQNKSTPRKYNMLSATRYGKICHNFIKIGKEPGEKSEYQLLYKYTFLKASYGAHLSCQGSNCDHIINGTDFNAFEEFKTHVDTCHREDEFGDSGKMCPLCSENFGSAPDLRRHLLEDKHGLECPFLCTTCWKPFKGRFSLREHEWSHKSEVERETCCEGDRPWKEKVKQKEEIVVCHVCGRDFGTERRLKLHLPTHLPKEQRRKFKCPQCPQIFLEAVGVRGHVERVHQRELLRWRKCPICNKEYNWRDGYKFRTHVRSHKDERNWVCEICGMAFLNTQGLKDHREKHGERERRFQCEFCEMSYFDRKHLKRHKKAKHKDMLGEEEGGGMEGEGEDMRWKFILPEYRPDFIGPRVAFPCPACEKVFPLRSRMTKHLKMYCQKGRELGMTSADN